MDDTFKLSIFLQVKQGDDFVDVASVTDCSPTISRDLHDVTEFDPVKRNPERTPLAVVFAWLSLRRPPPKFVPDEERVGKQEFMPGLISMTLAGAFTPLLAAGEDGISAIRDACYAGIPVRVRAEVVDNHGFEFGTVWSVNLYLREVSEQRFINPDRPREFTFRGAVVGEPEVSPNQPEDAHE